MRQMPKEGELPRISLQPLVQEVKRRKTGQFYPLMGKRARGKSLIQSVENKGGRSPVQLNKKAPKLSQPKEMAPLDKPSMWIGKIRAKGQSGNLDPRLPRMKAPPIPNPPITRRPHLKRLTLYPCVC
uniref:Uncharacterized protein LOC110215919 isoform X2 n=1 Tax=Phascolarctos cinereus TaxID=38626 RepID=A0A6P5L5T1_PHACI|nr:uncharacterized protein LOC110215919 isoform X2 [Phascolarctos cinereus]